jgi:hypothetical protein
MLSPHTMPKTLYIWIFENSIIWTLNIKNGST